VVRVTAGATLDQYSPRSWSVDPANPAHFRNVLEAFKDDDGSWEGTIQCWGLDLPQDPSDLAAGGASQVEVQALACQSTLHLVQALAEYPTTRLWMVTRGAQAVDDSTEIAVTQTPLWALGRTMLRERPECRATSIDLDPTDPLGSVEALFNEIKADSDEMEVAIRAGRRMVPRLKPRLTLAKTATADAKPVYLDAPQRGVVDNLALVPLTRRSPGPGEVEIEVRASGLNPVAWIGSGTSALELWCELAARWMGCVLVTRSSLSQRAATDRTCAPMPA